MNTFTKDVNFRSSAKSLLKHPWLGKEVEQKVSIDNDYNKITTVIDDYNRELEKQINKVPDSDEEEILKKITLTKAQTDKLPKPKKKEEQPAGSNNNAVSNNKPEKKKTDEKKKSKKVNFQQEEEEDWDKEFGISSSDLQNIKMSLEKSEKPDKAPLDSLGLPSVDSIDFADGEFEDLGRLANDITIQEDDTEWPDVSQIAPSLSTSVKAKSKDINAFSEAKDEFVEGFDLDEKNLKQKLASARLDEGMIEWVDLIKFDLKSISKTSFFFLFILKG